MEKRELICIGCPLGCPLTVTINGEDITVEGNTCKRGDTYAKKEVTNPTRIVTSSVKIMNGELERVSVKTASDIPKGKIFDIMDEIRNTVIEAPVAIGDIIITDCAGTGVDVVATKNVALG